MSYINHLLPKHAYNLLKDALKNIKHTVEISKEEKEINKKGLNLDIEGIKERIFTQQYIDYLSRYNKNLLSFSSPIQIDLEPNDKTYNVLFEKYIFKQIPAKKAEPKQVYDVVKKNLYPKIERYVNLDYKLTTKDINTLIIPVNVNFIGKNGQPVVGKAINFEISKNNLESNLSHLVSLIKAFDAQGEAGKYYLIGDEPNKQYKEQHNLWEHIKQLNYLDFIPLNETGIIEEFVNKKGVQPFIHK